MRASSSYCVKRLGHFVRILIGTWAFLASAAWAQYQNPGPPSQQEAPVPGTSAVRPRFSVDATLQLGDAGRPTVRLDYRLSRGELLFERSRPAGYRAAYEVRVIFYKTKGGRQVAGDTYTRELSALSYAETRQRGDDILDHIDFQVPSGRYRIEVAVTDLVAERTSGTAIEFEVPTSPPGLVWFSDLSLGTSGDPGRQSVGSAESIVPNPSRHYADDIVFFAATGEIVDQRADFGPNTTYHLSYGVITEGGERITSADTTLVRGGSRTPFVLRPRLGTLGAGTYRFLVELQIPPKAGGKSEKSSAIRRDKTFEVDQSRGPSGFASSQSLDVLRYVASREENEEIGKLQGEEARKAYWDSFWRRRDPTPGTTENETRDEFYQRVQYANQHFSTGTPGWKTDMGRTYITYGRPDEVVRNPFNFDRAPEEIWYYYRERFTFVFVDRDGFGRYELVSPSPSP